MQRDPRPLRSPQWSVRLLKPSGNLRGMKSIRRLVFLIWRLNEPLKSPQLVAGAEEAGQHRRRRESELARDFRRGEAADDLHEERLAILHGELQNRFPQDIELPFRPFRRDAALLLQAGVSQTAIQIDELQALALIESRMFPARDRQEPAPQSAAGSFSASCDLQARSSVSWAMSSASE
jgi:hypothetical protein